MGQNSDNVVQVMYFSLEVPLLLLCNTHLKAHELKNQGCAVSPNFEDQLGDSSTCFPWAFMGLKSTRRSAG